MSPLVTLGQLISAPEPQTASIIGTAVDIAVNPVPAATVTLDGPAPAGHTTVTTNENGFFTFSGLQPGVPYRVAVNAKGFAQYTSPSITLNPGQEVDLGDVTLKIQTVETTVVALQPEEIARQQIQIEEKQRVLGIIPNFYVVYEPNPVPLPAKLKFRLALRASTDVATIAGAAFIAGIEQAADTTPHYVQGAKGYGQRFGAGYADGVSGILIGGAILPSLLHQDPRYFYQGTGTNKSRALHAISAPFIARGDNGRNQINYSSMIGDLASGALSNLYYPDRDRGATLVFRGFALTTAGRIASTLAQEFILHKITTHPKPSQ